MADATTEIDLDSVIDRLLEGESPALARRRIATVTNPSPREPTGQSRNSARVRDQVPLYPRS